MVDILDQRKRTYRNALYTSFILLIVLYIFKLSYPQYTLLDTYFPPNSQKSSGGSGASASTSAPGAPKAKPPPKPFLPSENFNGTIDTKAAIIIETKFRPVLIPLILHFHTVLGPSWPILIYTSAESVGFYSSSSALSRYFHQGVIQIRILPQSLMLINADSMNQFMTDIWLWEDLAPAEHILIFQSDTMLCGNAARSVDDFFAFDFVGGAVAYTGRPFDAGLSLRKRSAMIRVLDNWEWIKDKESERFEDQFFYNKLAELSEDEESRGVDPEDEGAINLPDGDLAKTFSELLRSDLVSHPLPFDKKFPKAVSFAEMENLKSTTSSDGVVIITKQRILLVISIVLIWTLAHILPIYKPTIKSHVQHRIHTTIDHIPAIEVDWYPNHDPRSQFNSSKLAILIEGRPLPHLVPHLLHMISVVPFDWRFLFIGTNKSVMSVSRSFATQYQVANGKLDLLAIPKPWSIESKEMVDRMLTDLRFYERFLGGVEWMLKFESDAIICANSGDNLDDWLGYSWAGAPKSQRDRFAGNGGLSLRRISTVKKILGFQSRYNDTEPEDVWFGKRITLLPGATVASGEEEDHFAVENIWHEKPIGYHVRDGGKELPEEVWKDPQHRKDIFAYCPELSMIMPMKLERERCPEEEKQVSSEAKKLADDRGKKQGAQKKAN
ncbi:hypothetical protein B7494_g3392 [Chlorociboria aeruginascens]|nr:hypothetical protein B7494_g3392 [Chlorociboria aeruginascens]